MMPKLAVAFALIVIGCHDSPQPTRPQQATVELGAAKPTPLHLLPSANQEQHAKNEPILDGAGAASGWTQPRCEGPVFVRVRNASSADFDAAEIDGLEFGPVRAGAVSDYKPVEIGRCIYHNGSMSITSGKQRFMVFPIDFVGETPLPPGYYTQALTPTQSGDGQNPGGMAHRIARDPAPK